jgi:FkbM family methyltransferase
MNSARRKLEEGLWITGLHAAARSIYSATLGRQAALAQSKMRNFYSCILQPKTLVFDIGANVGVLSSTFASLGATVIAVEPNVDCVRHIQLSYQHQMIEVIQAAIGDRNGLAVLNVSDERDVRSSLSVDWISTMGNRDASYRDIWSRKNIVPMLTLDTLAEHFGLPHFVKIDVEGFEEKVLKGLSVQPPMVSFEFTSAFLAPAIGCLDLEVFKEGSMYNFAINADWGYPAKFANSQWLEKEELKKLLYALQGGETQGDIFVRAPT